MATTLNQLTKSIRQIYHAVEEKRTNAKAWARAAAEMGLTLRTGHALQQDSAASTMVPTLHML